MEGFFMKEHRGVKPIPPFIVSSVPKSGTHLTHQILNGVPSLSHDINNQEIKFFVNNPPTGFYEDHIRRLKNLKPNEFGLGHLHFTSRYANLLKELHLKHVFVYRDPRDVLISLTYFIPEKWTLHPLHEPFKNLTTKQRSLALIKGIKGKFPNFKEYFGPFYGWLHDKDSLHVSFEDLVGTDDSRQQTLHKIIRYLWNHHPTPLPAHRLVELMESNIEPTQSRTFRKGKIGSWKEEFDEETKNAFKDVAGQLLIETGYEKNHEW
jgi:hypothetical protein